MYNFMIDIVRNTVYVELSGYLSFEQIMQYVDDLNYLKDKFEPRMYSMLVMANRLDPLAQENLPHFQKATELALSWANRIAVVNGNRTLTLFQLKRIESSARKVICTDTKIMRFKTKKDALIFLCTN